jgi:acetyl-CoA synthetase
MTDKNMESVMHEERVFTPSESFRERAHINSMDTYKAMHQRSLDDPEGFWGDVAESLHWFKKWDRVLDDSEAPFYKWFTGGKTNICYNAVDRWADGPLADKRAIVWEGEPGDQRVLTYADLKTEVSRFANVLKSLGIEKGDTIAFYLPMTPELAIAVLACARIGAVHSVIFAGFSAESIRDRVLDGKSKMVITGDGGWRRGSVLPLKSVVDQGVEGCDCVEHVLVVPRNPGGERMECSMTEGRDVWYDERCLVR